MTRRFQCMKSRMVCIIMTWITLIKILTKGLLVRRMRIKGRLRMRSLCTWLSLISSRGIRHNLILREINMHKIIIIHMTIVTMYNFQTQEACVPINPIDSISNDILPQLETNPINFTRIKSITWTSMKILSILKNQHPTTKTRYQSKPHSITYNNSQWNSSGLTHSSMPRVITIPINSRDSHKIIIIETRGKFIIISHN